MAPEDRRRRAGHPEVFGETIAKFEFFQQGWNPFSRFLDVDKVDLILRRRSGDHTEYREVQVKSGRLYRAPDELAQWQQEFFDMTSWSKFDDGEFEDADPNLYVVYVVSDVDLDEYRGDIFIFRAPEFAAVIRAADLSGGKRHVYMARCRDELDRWFVMRDRTKRGWLDRGGGSLAVTDATCVEVSRYRRNFAVLDAPLL